MSLETITGNLKDGYKQLQPGTMLHVDELMNERRDNRDLRNIWFYTADGEIYFLDRAGNPALAMTREAHNPVLKNIDDAFEQLRRKQNYRPSQEDVQQALAAPDTVLIDLLALRLSEHGSEFSYLSMGTNPAEYGRFNEEERKFAERVYGQGADFAKNMKMLKKDDINYTRIWVLNPDYIRKHAEEGAIARVSCLNSLGYSSRFSADTRGIIDSNRVRGVRKETDSNIERSR